MKLEIPEFSGEWGQGVRREEGIRRNEKGCVGAHRNLTTVDVFERSLWRPKRLLLTWRISFNSRAVWCRSESLVHVISGSRQSAGNSRKLY